MLFHDLCLHCGVASTRHLFCEVCADNFELIQGEGRCTSCYKPSDKSLCYACYSGHLVAHNVATAFEPLTSAAALLKPVYAKLRASLLVYQFMRLDWPLPEVVFPESRATAREVARLLKVPLRTFGPFYRKRVLVIADQIDDTWRHHPINRRLPLELRVLAFIDHR